MAASIAIFILFWIVFGSIMLWTYGLTPIVHWIIKSNGDTAKAKILEIHTAGWGWYAGDRYNQSLIFRPVRVKLEVHPSTGAPYVAKDQFNAKAEYYRNTLKPGAELQVSISRWNPQWVASWPETAVEGQGSKQIERGMYASQPAMQAAAPASTSTRSNVPLLVGGGIAVILLCACLLVAGGLIYTRYYAGNAITGITNPIVPAAATSAPAATAVPPAQNAGVVPTGGLASEINRASAWAQTLAAILQADPTRCTSPDGVKTTIRVLQKPKGSGPWQELWSVACDGAPSIPVGVTFIPADGGVDTVTVKVAK